MMWISALRYLGNSASGAIVLGQEIEKYRPFFYEDPIPPDNFDAMAYVASKVRIPIATGERLMTVYEVPTTFRKKRLPVCKSRRVFSWRDIRPRDCGDG